MSDDTRNDYAVEVGFIQVIDAAVHAGMTTPEQAQRTIAVTPVGYVFD